MAEIFLKIDKPYKGKYAFLHTGFRPFFLLSAWFSAILMLVWGAILNHGKPNLGSIYANSTPIAWHGHEMLFGFALAVIAGFLLTAVKNWTQQKTYTHLGLAVLAILWLIPRFLAFIPFAEQNRENAIFFNMLAENLFLLMLCWKFSSILIKTKKYMQFAIIGKLWLFIPASVCFHLGLLGIWNNGVCVGLYSAFYLILALILTMARRVMPMFIERGVGVPGVVVKNFPSVDKFSLILFLLFAIIGVAVQILPENKELAFAFMILAAVQAILHILRLGGWYHKAIWQKPLLWSLFAGYICIVGGFLLAVLEYFGVIPVMTLSLHSFTVGGIGLFTFAMMARISLGHTGRSVFTPPKYLNFCFIFLLIAFVGRVLILTFFPEYRTLGLHLSQTCWILASVIFGVLYTKILILARVDGVKG